MKLFIVEAPNKIKKAKSFLPDDFIVKSSVGSIKTIPSKGMNIDIENGFKPRFEIMHGKHDIVNELIDLANDANEIFLATDLDREGEAIAAHIAVELGAENYKKCKRVVYGELTKRKVLEAIENPREIDRDLVDAQKARQVLDRLIGYSVSPILWNAVASRTSAGRVQSVALRIICDRQKEIDAFKKNTFWYIDANLVENSKKLTARVITENKDNRFHDKEVADKTLLDIKEASFKVGSVSNKTKKVKPYPPLDTTGLQQACSAMYKWDGEKTMKIAQSLYESGLCTYIRTDSYNISDEAIAEVRELIARDHGSEYLPVKPNEYRVKSTVAAQEAHECIRPTDMSETGVNLESDERRMYDVIFNRFVACQMNPQKVSTSEIIIETNKEHKLICKGQTVTFDGWTKVVPTKTDQETLPVLKKGQDLSCKNAISIKGETKPPPRFNDGTVVKKMRDDGVGRPATTAGLLKSLETKGYVVKDKTSFVPTELGMKICSYLTPKFEDFFMDIKFTAKLESELDDIASGKKTYLDVVEPVYSVLMKKIEACGEDAINESGVTCSKCNVGKISKRSGKFGAFWTCNNYPDCKTVYEKVNDEFVEKRKPKKAGALCPKCGSSVLIRYRRKDNKPFYACSAYPKCKFTRDA